MGSFKSGAVGVLGQPNVGKSTFLNAVMGEKLVITSDKPQTTRSRIRCVYTTEAAQIVFVDTPGLHAPQNLLSRRVLREALRALREVDVIAYMVEPWGKVTDYDQDMFDRLPELFAPMILLVNKVDLAKGNALEETLLAYDATGKFQELIPVCATQGLGIEDAVATIISYLPERSPLFPPDVKTDQSEEFLVAELIREKVFQLTYHEIPYATAVRVKWMHDRDDGIREIKAEIVVDRDSQKGIIIGKGGRLIKRIGTQARMDIERLLGRHVFLDLKVAVRKGWTRDAAEIERLTSFTKG